MTEWPSALALRALTSDQQIRVAAVDASALWDGLRRGHPQLEADACACLMELLSATALLNSRVLFLERLQLVLAGSGRAGLVASDCWPDGALRGVLDPSGRVEGPWADAPGTLKVLRSGASGEPWAGSFPLVAGPINSQVEAYLQEVEHVQAAVTLWCDPATGQAGGLLVEPLPSCPPQRLGRLVQALEGLEVLQDHERVPAFLVDWVNGGEGAEILARVDLAYRCRCSKSSLRRTLLDFPEGRRRDLFAAGSQVEVRCDYCGKIYRLERQLDD